MLKTVFFGTDRFSLYTLRALHDNLRLAPNNVARVIGELKVVAPPDAPAQRGHKLRPCLAKQFALENGLDCFQPDNPKTIRKWHPAFLDSASAESNDYAFDLAVVVSFRYFVPEHIVSRFRFGGLNVHPSLLPLYRGPAPLHHTILNGDRKTGVSIIDLDLKTFDAGNIVDQVELDLTNPEKLTYLELEQQMGELGAQRLMHVVTQMAQKDSRLVGKANEMREGMLTAPKVPREMFDFRFTQMDAVTADRRFRALGHGHVHCFMTDSTRVRIVSMHLHSPTAELELHDKAAQQLGTSPGSTLYTSGSILVRCVGGGVVALTELQLDGKRAVSAADFHNGVVNRLRASGTKLAFD
jgi:methionyl-tRNA formyltransferase